MKAAIKFPFTLVKHIEIAGFIKIKGVAYLFYQNLIILTLGQSSILNL